MMAKEKMMEYRAFRSQFPYKNNREILQDFFGATYDYTYAVGPIGVKIYIQVKVDKKPQVFELVEKSLNELGYSAKRMRKEEYSAREITRVHLPPFPFRRTVGFFGVRDSLSFYFHDNEIKRDETVRVVEGVIRNLKENKLFVPVECKELSMTINH